jgi:hypothetical protein
MAPLGSVPVLTVDLLEGEFAKLWNEPGRPTQLIVSRRTAWEIPLYTKWRTRTTRLVDASLPHWLPLRIRSWFWRRADRKVMAPYNAWANRWWARRKTKAEN